MQHDTAFLSGKEKSRPRCHMSAGLAKKLRIHKNVQEDGLSRSCTSSKAYLRDTFVLMTSTLRRTRASSWSLALTWPHLKHGAPPSALPGVRFFQSGAVSCCCTPAPNSSSHSKKLHFPGSSLCFGHLKNILQSIGVLSAAQCLLLPGVQLRPAGACTCSQSDQASDMPDLLHAGGPLRHAYCSTGID